MSYDAFTWNVHVSYVGILAEYTRPNVAIEYIRPNVGMRGVSI